MKSLMPKKKRILNYLNNQEYGEVLNFLSKINLDKLYKKKRANYRIIKGILWELLGNFPKALKSYKKSLEIIPKNVIAFQYQTQLLAVMGKYPITYQRYREIFESNPELKNPFEIKRSYIGFRDRLVDLMLLNSFNPSNRLERDLKNYNLGLIYFSINEYQKGINLLRKNKQSNIYTKILISTGEFLINNDPESIENLKKLKIDNIVDKCIKNLIEALDYNDIDNEKNLYNYNPIIHEALKEDLKNIEGWFDYCEANLLYQLVTQVPRNQANLIIVVEIGAFLGKSTITIAKAVKESGGGWVYSIDPHEGIPYYHPQPTLSDFIENIGWANVNDIVKICLGNSDEWSDNISASLSMIFIDGDHTYEVVKKDYSKWEEKIIINGLIAFHDAIQDGPFKLISELLNSQNFRLIFIVGSLAILQKKGHNKNDIISALNQILLNIYRLHYLEFLKKDNFSKRDQIEDLINRIFK